MAKKTVRILRQLPVDGVLYQPEQLVAFEKAAADQYVEAGAADDNKAAVAYCKGQGVELITHVVPIAQAKAAQEAAEAEAKAVKEAAEAAEAAEAEAKAVKEAAEAAEAEAKLTTSDDEASND